MTYYIYYIFVMCLTTCQVVHFFFVFKKIKIIFIELVIHFTFAGILKFLKETYLTKYVCRRSPLFHMQRVQQKNTKKS